MKIASWNVNSVKARLPNLTRWLEETAPDIACLQELKCVDEAFPREDIEALGYNVETHGQKTYNGVALLSKYPLEDVRRGLPGFEDEQARYIEAVVSANGSALRVASLYLPNGNPVTQKAATLSMRNIPISSAGWQRWRRMPKRFCLLRRLLCWRAIITSSPHRLTATPPTNGRAMPSTDPKRTPPSGACSIWG